MTTADVLVVVPVYGDLESLLRCVDGLVEHLDTTRHRVLLVNDCGPDADAIERALLERIDGREAFRYERNESNLGFVGTCNRAVLELDTAGDAVLLLNSDAVPTAGFLDAMVAVLDGDGDGGGRVGVVTARSNNATIASIPYRLTNRNASRTEERTAEVWSALFPHLPESQVSPVAMGFCFLTRRSLIAEHGLFDEAFAPGYGEENDYCLRIAAHGWTARIANRALVQHAGGKSFTGNRNALRAAHQRLLEERYPFLPEAVAGYQRHGATAAERFADCLVPSGATLRAAVDLRGVADAADMVGRLADALGDDFGLEARLAPGTHLTSDAVRVVEDVNPDDLVTLAVLVDPTPAEVVEANRRALMVAVVRTEQAPTPWASASHRTGGDLVLDTLAPHAVAVIDADHLTDLAAAAHDALAAPLADRVAAVTARWTAMLPLDVVAADAASGSDESARLRAELAELRGSRTYRTGETIAKLTRRLPGRR